MTDAPDLNVLARRYLDLWQQQVSTLANDPAMADVVARVYTMMTRGVQAMAVATGVSPVAPRTESDGREPNRPDDSRPLPQGTEAVAPSSRGSGIDVDRLADRVAELEGRIFRLEAAFAAGRGAVETRPRRRRG